MDREIFISSEAIQSSAVSFDSPQSFRGSRSNLVAQGDYSIFFVGADNRTIWGLFYDDGVSGFRSAKVSEMGPELTGDVTAMAWSQAEDCLYVITDAPQLLKFFYYKEKNIMGWTRVTSEIPHFHPHNVLRVGDDVEIISARFFENELIRMDAYRVTVGQSFDQDGERYKIQKEIEFIKEGQPIRSGSTAQFVKQVGDTVIHTKGVKAVRVGNRSQRVAADRQGRIETAVESGVSPRLKITHATEEEFEILSTFSKINVQEK